MDTYFPDQTAPKQPSRRFFLKSLGVAGGALVLGTYAGFGGRDLAIGAFNRRDLRGADIADHGLAGPHRRSVHMDGTRTAQCLAAAELCAV